MNDIMTDLIETTIRNRCAEMVKQMTTTLYGDFDPPPTRWQRIKWKVSGYRRRVTDAWLVLRGKAYIE